MCGISGIISTKINKDERDTSARLMNKGIFHRGPDDDGFYSDEQCSLSMRRLSIIDLETGKQPIYSNNNESFVFFNGEIYNFKELQADLLVKGFSFKTTSDTEVLVNLYQCYGIDMLKKLKGMFAFCIYDKKQDQYLFARDRFGEKPFFYHYSEKGFFFSSELCSLVSAEAVPRKLNHRVLGEYLSRSFVSEPDTLFDNIYSLPPGNFLIYNKNGIKVLPYFEVVYKPDKSITRLEDAASFIEPYLSNSVKRQMVSDVPIGAFLSGGIDSSTVVALMQKYAHGKVKTFNVKFQTQGYDESKIARKVAEKIGTEHHEIVVENHHFTEDQFWKILRHTGAPFPDSSAIPTDIVTSAISKNVKVALSGDGGDELFAGYTVFDWYNSVNRLKRIPSGLLNGLGSIVSMINSTPFGNNRLRQISKALDISTLDGEEMLMEIHALFDKKELAAIFSGNVKKTQGTEFELSGFSPIRKAMFYRIKYDLPLDMLVKVDRMSMSNSLEVRTPFLDPDLFEASCKIPEKFLRQKGVGKLVLREIMKDELPDEVFNHPKSGFSIPMHDFRNQNFKELAESLLLNNENMNSLFNRNKLEAILRTGLTDSKDSSSGSIYRKTHQLWSLMMLSGWMKMYKVEI